MFFLKTEFGLKIHGFLYQYTKQLIKQKMVVNGSLSANTKTSLEKIKQKNLKNFLQKAKPKKQNVNC